ncbi:MAG: beta(1,3)galactosyltransferase EpsH [Bacilli bacterium]|nr:beta(1,3)galactosyltransferase EpsH [Bacilli bacterium]
MIFVCLGTQDKEFKRLPLKIEELVNNRVIKEEVIMQVGTTKFSSNKIKVYDMMSMDKFANCVKNCDLLITHGGVGTILDALKHNKKIIAFPRLAKYHEHVNDHQIQIINEFYNNGYLLTGEIDDMEKLILKSKNFTPKKYKSNNYKFNKLIDDYIENMLK